VSPTSDPEKLGYRFGLMATDAPELIACLAGRLLVEP